MEPDIACTFVKSTLEPDTRKEPVITALPEKGKPIPLPDAGSIICPPLDTTAYPVEGPEKVMSTLFGVDKTIESGKK